MLLAAVLALVSCPPAGAQQGPAEPGGGEVDVRLEQLGVGNAFRPGDLTGIRLALMDRSDSPRAVAVRLHLEDADGDRPLYQRTVTLTPGQALGVWLYAKLPFEVGQTLNVTIHEAAVRETGEITVGRQIGGERLSTGAAVRTPPDWSLYAVIGDRALGLEQYGRTGPNQEDSITSHEVTRVVTGIPAAPAALPDDWRGWASYEVIAWTGGDPLAIGADAQAQAIREWVHRGGHLVVVLPAIGSTWESSANPFGDLMPSCQIIRREEVDLDAYRHLLTTPEFADRELPASAVVHTFRIREDTPVSDAAPIVTGPGGEPVVVRRLVGAGMVTVVGIDLRSRMLAPIGTLRADAFWHRLLGKRFDVLTTDQANTWGRQGGFLAQETLWADRQVSQVISKEKDAGFGILMGLVIFILYWLVSGPVGFGVLKKMNRAQHAWVAFVGASAVFTVVAWVGANTFRLKGTGADHLTIIDHVYAQGVQSARMWASVFLPEYGEMRLTVGAAEREGEWRQSLVPWEDPARLGAGSFPDARPYVIDVRNPGTMEVPSRSTIKQVRADWLGASGWGTPTPMGTDARPSLDASGRLSGRLVHELPGPLERIRVVLVTGQLTEEEAFRARARVDRSQRHDGLLLARAYAWSVDDWAPGDPLDLSQFAPGPAFDAAEYLESTLVPRRGFLGGTEAIAPDGRDFERLTFYGVLEPPDYGRPPGQAGLTRIGRRQAHFMDISKWFTQPCLIIYGELEDEASPVPLYVDGEACPTTGRTILRWIYPLSPEPVRFDGRIDGGGRVEPADAQEESE